MRAAAWAGFAASSVLLLSGCRQPREEVVVFFAGSLGTAMHDLEHALRKAEPGLKLVAEASSSREAVRKVAELKRPADVVLSADEENIRDFLLPGRADWFITFARNRMALVYTQQAKYVDEIDESNWFRVLARPDVKIGRCDPELAPVGYRTLMLWQLADLHYKKKLDGKSIHAALLEKSPPDSDLIRKYETELLPLIRSYDVDYVFAYLSLARGHNLRSLTFPEEIDLSQPSLAERYAQARFTLQGPKGGRPQTILGAPIVYALTIPKDAPHPESARRFVRFLLSEEA